MHCMYMIAHMVSLHYLAKVC